MKSYMEMYNPSYISSILSSFGLILVNLSITYYDAYEWNLQYSQSVSPCPLASIVLHINIYILKFGLILTSSRIPMLNCMYASYGKTMHLSMTYERCWAHLVLSGDGTFSAMEKDQRAKGIDKG